MDVAEYVARMMELMENVAGIMIESTESGVVLRESVEAEAVTAEARKIFGGAGEQIVAILLGSSSRTDLVRAGRFASVSFSGSSKSTSRRSMSGGAVTGQTSIPKQ